MNSGAVQYTPLTETQHGPARLLSAEAEAHALLWRHFPWMLALMIAPLWFGAVSSAAQTVLAFLISFSLLACRFQLRLFPSSVIGRFVLVGLAGLLLFSLLPLPAGISRVLSPEAADLRARFPLSVEPARIFSMTLSPADTVIRLWQLAMIAAVFCLARAAAPIRGFTEAFSAFIAVAVILCGSAEVWRWIDGHGIWSEVRNYPAGTFANRSHFAAWMSMGAIFLLGPFTREVKAARAAGSSQHASAAALFGFAVLIGAAMTVASGSRGGMLSLCTGVCIWAVILIRKKEQGIALLLFGVLLFFAIAAFWIWGETLMRRIHDDGVSFKFQIWRDSLDLVRKFPLFGIGLGSFESAFNHFKTFYGQGTFLFAENEYLQWLVETGFIGAILGALGFALILKMVFVKTGGRIAKPELFDGAVAAFGAFATHSAFEFLFHVMAVALFGAALLGICFGLKERAAGPRVLPAPGTIQVASVFLLILLLAAAAVPQAVAGLRWRSSVADRDFRAARELQRSSLNEWPLDARRSLAFVRASVLDVEQGKLTPQTGFARARAAMDRALSWRPYDWQLRLEDAWLRLAFAPSDPASLENARAVVELAPLQAQIPLRLAATLAKTAPPRAMELLTGAPLKTPEEVRSALNIAWEVDHNPASLWTVVPATAIGFKELEVFAKDHNLAELAGQARQRQLQQTQHGPQAAGTNAPRDSH